MSYQNATMKWILLKFLKDSLDFLADDPRAKGMKRMDWVQEWMDTEIPKAILWLPKDTKMEEE